MRVVNPALGPAIQTAITALTGRSEGDNLQAALQTLGMGQRPAALLGALHDLSLGNLAGYQKNLFEAFTGVDPGRIRANLAKAHFMRRPCDMLGVKFQRVDLAKSAKGDLAASLLGAAGGFALGGPFGALAGGALGKLVSAVRKRCRAMALERRLNHDPVFRARFEAMVGGKYIPDGRNDGKITIARPNFCLPGLNPGIFGALSGNIVAGGCLAGLAKLMGNAVALMRSMGLQTDNSVSNTGLGAKQKCDIDRSSGGPGSAVSRLPPNATFEDLVAAFMTDVVKEMQDEAKKKMDQIRQSMNSNRADGSNRASGPRRGYGGFLRGLAGAVLKIGGSILGGLVGGPIGSMIGSKLGQAVGSAVAGAPKGAEGTKGAEGKKGEDSRTLMFEELKQIMNKLSQMQQALSNVLNTMHQGAMNAIRNIRA